MEGQETPVNERSHYFTGLPDSTVFSEFYAERSGITVGYFTDRTVRSFNRYGWNLSRKYGDDWRSECASFAVSRLKSWGMNTAYSGSVHTLRAISGIPYAARLSTRAARRVEGSSGYWGKFSDPYDDGFGKAILNGMERISETVSDPYCIGFFVDNEMSWGDNSYLARSVIQSDRDQPAKWPCWIS